MKEFGTRRKDSSYLDEKKSLLEIWRNKKRMCQVSDGVNPATLRGEMGCSMLAREKVFSLSHVSNIAGRSHQRDELRTRLDLMLSISSKIISERYDCVRAPVVSLKLSKECEHGGSLYERIHANNVASFRPSVPNPEKIPLCILRVLKSYFFPAGFPPPGAFSIIQDLRLFYFLHFSHGTLRMARETENGKRD